MGVRVCACVWVRCCRGSRASGVANRPCVCPLHAVPIAGRPFTVSVCATDGFRSSLATPNPGIAELALGLAMKVAVDLMVWSAVCWWLRYDSAMAELAAQDQERSAIQAAKDTNNRIVGYVCHELRNPLHVLETWFGVMMGGGVSPAEELDAAACQDIVNALGQMRGIVNDILDYRAVSYRPSAPLLPLLPWWGHVSRVRERACVCVCVCVCVRAYVSLGRLTRAGCSSPLSP